MISQVKSVKITAQNLKSIVLEGSKKVQELEKKKQFTRERLEEKRLQEEEEKALEKRTKKIQKGVGKLNQFHSILWPRERDTY